MPKNVVKLPKIANQTIDAVVRQFIQDKASAKGIRTQDKKGAAELFIHCLNAYGHQSLSREESKLFDRYCDLKGSSHKEFCQIFGPDRIAENVPEFVGYFLIRKVMMSGDQMAVAAKVVAELCKWLVAKNIVPGETIVEAIERAERAVEELPRAEDANRMIWEQAQKSPRRVRDYLDFGQLTFNRIEKDQAWVETEDGQEIGPVVLPKKAGPLLKPGWTINSALIEAGGKWYFQEVGNVYPD